MVCIGKLGGYLQECWEEMKLEDNSEYFFEEATEFFISHEGGWFGTIYFFPVLCLIAIN